MIARPREDLFKKARNPSVSSLLSGFWILDFKILGLEGENKIGTPLKIRKGKEEQIQGMRMEDKDKRTTAACQKSLRSHGGCLTSLVLFSIEIYWQRKDFLSL